MDQLSEYLPLMYMILGVLGALALIFLIRVFIKLAKALGNMNGLVTELDLTAKKTNQLLDDVNQKSERLDAPLDELIVLVTQVTHVLNGFMNIFMKVQTTTSTIRKFTKKRGAKK